jgi:FRG domain
MARLIKSVTDFIQKVFEEVQANDLDFYYRGHSDFKYVLKPSVFRSENLEKNENIMFEEIISSSPQDFLEDSTSLEKLVRMQHYGLPTRLLDITSNPLIGLFFACESGRKVNGEVVIFSVPKNNIKFSSSDAISILANLSRLTHEEKVLLRGRDFVESITRITMEMVQRENFNEDEFNENYYNIWNNNENLQRLYHFIRQEKPSFLPKINPKDIEKIYCVKPKMNNKRIISQVGAFFIFGTSSSFENNPEIRISRIRIDKKKKEEILNQLDKLNINNSTVYPYLENTARYIRQKYE